ncbi:unnamed protein product [Closterium sp. NIES-53]
MASMPALNRGNSSAPSSDTDRNAREMTGHRRNKRRAEEGPPAPTAVDVLLGGLEVNRNSSPPQQQHPSAPVAPEARVAQVATAALAALVAPHAPDAEHTPAHVDGPSRQRQRRRTATSSDATTPALTNALTPDQVAALLSLLQQQPASVTATEIAQPAASASAKKENTKGEKGARGTTANRHDKEAPASIPPAPAADNDTDGSDDDDGEAPVHTTNFNSVEHLPPLPSTTNTTWSAATFNDAHVRAKAEILEDMRAYLKHAEYKLQHGDLAGGLEMVVAALDNISARFDMFQVEDAADDRVAKRYKMYLQKSLLTSRPFKQAVADVAAMDRVAGAHARSHRGGNHGAMAFSPKRGPPTSGNFQGFRGSCFRCGQPGHVANACPRNGHGGQGPAPGSNLPVQNLTCGTAAPKTSM